MKPNSVQTVTMPVLVAAMSATEASGFMPFELEESGLTHTVTEDDAARWVKTEFSSTKDHALFVAINLLKWAWDEEDEFTAARAFQMLKPYVQSNIPANPTVVFVHPTMSMHWGGWGLSAIPSAYTWLVTEVFQSARFVMWHSEEEDRFLPGLYCPTRRIAVFALGIMKRLRVCPKCDIPFIPDDDKMAYCCLKHYEAHRIARFRARQKRDAIITPSDAKATVEGSEANRK